MVHGYIGVNMYIIVNKNNNEVFAIENYKSSADKYNAKNFEILVWDIDISGSSPQIGEMYFEARNYSDLRETAYKHYSDPEYTIYRCILDYDGIGNGEVEKEIWRDAVEKIKLKYPKPE